MNMYLAIALGVSLIYSIPCSAAEGVCKKCQIIREYNRTHPSNYEYYDDYLNDLQTGKVKQNQPQHDDQPQYQNRSSLNEEGNS